MLPVKIKRSIVLCLILIVGYITFLGNDYWICMLMYLGLPIFTFFIVDDLIRQVRRQENSISKFRLKAADIALILIFIAEMINPLLSGNSLISQLASCRIAGAILLILWGRIYLDHHALRLLCVHVVIMGTLVSLMIIVSFLNLYHTAISAGFEDKDLIALRSLFIPCGIMINDWAGILIAFLPFAFYVMQTATGNWMRYIMIFPFILIVFAILLTFARGAWSALCVFGLLVLGGWAWHCSGTFFSRRILFAASLSVTSMVLVLTCFGQSVSAMMDTHPNGSQVRSVTGRFERWQRCRDLIEESPLRGIGNGNYAVESMIISNKDGSGYTRRVNNIGIQIALEKGLVGIILYGVLLLILARRVCISLRSGIRIAPWIFGIGGIALLIREMTFTTLLENPTCLFLGCMIIWVLITETGYEKGRVV